MKENKDKTNSTEAGRTAGVDYYCSMSLLFSLQLPSACFSAGYLISVHKVSVSMENVQKFVESLLKKRYSNVFQIGAHCL